VRGALHAGVAVDGVGEVKPAPFRGGEQIELFGGGALHRDGRRRSFAPAGWARKARDAEIHPSSAHNTSRSRARCASRAPGSRSARRGSAPTPAAGVAPVEGLGRAPREERVGPHAPGDRVAVRVHLHQLLAHHRAVAARGVEAVLRVEVHPGAPPRDTVRSGRNAVGSSAPKRRWTSTPQREPARRQRHPAALQQPHSACLVDGQRAGELQRAPALVQRGRVPQRDPQRGVEAQRRPRPPKLREAPREHPMPLAAGRRAEVLSGGHAREPGQGVAPRREGVTEPAVALPQRVGARAEGVEQRAQCAALGRVDAQRRAGRARRGARSSTPRRGPHRGPRAPRTSEGPPGAAPPAPTAARRRR
jgi:hypothetical protein